MALTRQEYLKAMGIEVWSLRPVEAGPEVPMTAPVIETQPTRKARPKAKPETAAARPRQPSADIPRFRFALLHYESIGLCLSLRENEELPRRFCDDIARSMEGNVDAVRYQLLEWPMLSTSGIDQSIQAAREVVTQKFRVLPPRVMVFGDDVAHYYSPLRDLAPMEIGCIGAQDFMLIPSLAELMASASAKRELMMTLIDWCADQ